MRIGPPLLAISLFLLGAAPTIAATCDPTTLATLRSAADSCDCTGAASHGAYLKCVTDAIKTAAKSSGASKSCEKEAKKCAAKSTCGKSGAAACVITKGAGANKCVIKKDSAACKAPKGGSACAATEPSCCDASCGG